MAFSFRRHIILSRLHDLRNELSIAAVEQKKAEEEKKKPKKAKMPESEKARKTKRRIIIFLYVAGIAHCIATLTYVMIYFCIENGVFGVDDWRENRFLFAFYDWLMEDEPVSDGLYSLKKEYYYGFSLYAVLSMYAGTIGTFALIYMLRAYIRGKTKDKEIPLFDDNGMRLDVKMTLENTYGDIINYRDWDKLDMIIYLLETYRADTIKEALRIIDREQQQTK